MIPLEEEALAEWMMVGIILLPPPTLSWCVHSLGERRFRCSNFYAYLEKKVIAVVPPFVRIPQQIAEKTLLLQLLERREGDKAPDHMSRKIVNRAKKN